MNRDHLLVWYESSETAEQVSTRLGIADDGDSYFKFSHSPTVPGFDTTRPGIRSGRTPKNVRYNVWDGLGKVHPNSLLPLIIFDCKPPGGNATHGRGFRVRLICPTSVFWLKSAIFGYSAHRVGRVYTYEIGVLSKDRLRGLDR